MHMRKTDVPEMTGIKLDLFETAITLFAERGYMNVTMRDIGTATNRNHSSIYNHFSSKEEFLATAFDFYRTKYYQHLPSLKSLIALIPNTPPQKIWEKIPPDYEPELLDTMTKIILIAFEERRRNTEAKRLLSDIFIETPRKYLKVLLAEMEQKKLVSPVKHIDDFINLYSAFNISASTRIGSDHSMSEKEWRAGNSYLFHILTSVK